MAAPEEDLLARYFSSRDEAEAGTVAHSPRRCEGAPGADLRCVDVHGAPYWQVGDLPSEHIASTSCDAPPWRVQLMCTPSPSAVSKRCFRTTYEGTGALVCAAVPEGPLQTSALGSEGIVADLHPSTSDVEVSASEAHNFEPCVVHALSGVRGRDGSPGALAIHVPKGSDPSVCAAIHARARSACEAMHDAETCDRAVIKQPDPPPKATYRCSLDTKRVPVALPGEDNPWYSWIRSHEPCEGDAQQCHGICERGTCLGATYATCRTDADCDSVPARDPAQRASVTYRMPAPCAVADASLPTRYAYCGKTDAGTYTGYCAPYTVGDTTFQGCKPFRDEAERKKLQEVELARVATNRFFREDERPTFLKTEVCRPGDVISQDGFFVGTATTETVAASQLIDADSEEDAHARCNAHFGVAGLYHRVDRHEQ